MDRQMISTSSRTEKGRRTANEDACLVMTSEELGGDLDCLLIVADGMGGRASGAMASGLAIASVKETVLSLKAGGDMSEVLSRGLRKANDAVFGEAGRRPELKGMGTTCVAAAVRGDRLCCAHLGDSRAYLMRNGEMLRLTQDHSFVAEKVRTGEMTEKEARSSRFRNVITRAIGLEAEAAPEVVDTYLKPGDVILLCTDGLSTPVADDDIADILCTSSDPEEACGRLISSALRNGGSDNITVIVAAYGSAKREKASVPAPARRSPLLWVVPAIFGLIVGLLLGASPLRELLPKWPQATRELEQPAVPDLAHLEYGDPVSLYYAPVQKGILTLDARGYIHVADSQGRLIRLDTTGQVIHEFPPRKQLKPVEQAAAPRIAADVQGNLYVSDPTAKRILKYAGDGTFLTAIAEGRLVSPVAIAVDEEGAIYVIDGGRLKAVRPRKEVQEETDRPTAGGDQ